MFLGHERCKMSVKYAMCSSLEAYFLPRAKTVLLVKQRHFHLFTDLINLSYSLLKQIWHKWILWSTAPFSTSKNNQGIFGGILSQKVEFNDDERVSSWGNVERQVYPSLVTVLHWHIMMHNLLLAPSTFSALPLYCWATENLGELWIIYILSGYNTQNEFPL